MTIHRFNGSVKDRYIIHIGITRNLIKKLPKYFSIELDLDTIKPREKNIYAVSQKSL